MQQVQDFMEECFVLAKAVEGLDDADFNQVTQFKGWTINDVLVHLHFWNKAANVSLQNPDAFQAMLAEIMASFADSGLRAYENGAVSERGPVLRDVWWAMFEDIGQGWRDVDPKTRVSWAGPDMSVRSAITARQMETWAHGQEVFDTLGKVRVETDRIRNIVVLGVNTFGWSFKVHDQEVPELVPELSLTAPSGDLWFYGSNDSRSRIEGSAVEFCQVVAQTRNIADTNLTLIGSVANKWMEIAQCFAGPPETPPPTGSRFRDSSP